MTIQMKKINNYTNVYYTENDTVLAKDLVKIWIFPLWIKRIDFRAKFTNSLQSLLILKKTIFSEILRLSCQVSFLTKSLRQVFKKKKIFPPQTKIFYLSIEILWGFHITIGTKRETKSPFDRLMFKTI